MGKTSSSRKASFDYSLSWDDDISNLCVSGMLNEHVKLQKGSLTYASLGSLLHEHVNCMFMVHPQRPSKEKLSMNLSS